MLFKANSFFKEKMEMDAIAPKDIDKDEEKKDEVKEMDMAIDAEKSDEEKLKGKKEADETSDGMAAKGEDSEKDPDDLSAVAEADMSMGHEDEEQDKELIKKVIADTFGGAEEMSNEEVMEMCKEVYGAFGEMGYPVDKAMAAVGSVMKYAKHLADKGISKDEEKPKEEGMDIKKDEEEEKKDAVAEAGEEEVKDDEEKVEEAGEEEEDEEKKVEESEEEDDEDKDKVKEMDKAQDNKDDMVVESNAIIKLKAENAALKEQIKGTKVKDHLEKVLSESGMPRAATKIFRENIGTPKSTKDIDSKFKLFVETYRAAQGSETIGLPFVISTEKKTNNSDKQGLDFADCID